MTRSQVRNARLTWGEFKHLVDLQIRDDDYIGWIDYDSYDDLLPVIEINRNSKTGLPRTYNINNIIAKYQ